MPTRAITGSTEPAGVAASGGGRAGAAPRDGRAAAVPGGGRVGGVERPADRCPGVLRLHDAGDGLLARVRLPGGRLDRRGLATLADGAALGNGLAELTSRASVQLRGLPPRAAAPLARLLSAGGLLPSEAHDRVRNVLASPLAGRLERSLLPTDALVAALDAALVADPALAALPGRFLFALDDGAGLVDLAAADVALAAEPAAAPADACAPADAGAPADADADAPADADVPADAAAPADAGMPPGLARFRLWLAGRPTARTVAPADAVATLTAVARAFLALRAELAPTAWHVADLPGGAEALADATVGALPLADSAAQGVSRTPRAAEFGPGLRAQRDGRVAITALAPLARLDEPQLRGLHALAGEHGLDDLRVAPERTLTLPDLPPDAAPAIARALDGLGLVTSPGSGWRGLTACSGLGACRRARVDVRAAAAARAAVRGADAPPEHWSACPRRCGMKRDVAVGVVAGDDTLQLFRAGRPHAEAADPEHALDLLNHPHERPAA